MNILDIYRILVNFEVLLLRRCFYLFLGIQLIMRCFYLRGAAARQTGQSIKGALIQSVLMFRRGEYQHRIVTLNDQNQVKPVPPLFLYGSL